MEVNDSLSDGIVIEDVDSYLFEVSPTVSLVFYPEGEVWVAEVCGEDGDEGTILLSHNGEIEGEEKPLVFDSPLIVEDIEITPEMLQKFRDIVEGSTEK